MAGYGKLKITAKKVRAAGDSWEEYFYERRKEGLSGEPDEETKQVLRDFNFTWKDVFVCRLCHADPATHPRACKEKSGGVLREKGTYYIRAAAQSHLLEVHGIDTRPPPKHMPSASWVLGSNDETWFAQLESSLLYEESIHAGVVSAADDWRASLIDLGIPHPESITKELTADQARAALAHVLCKGIGGSASQLYDEPRAAEAWAAAFVEALPAAKFFSNADWTFDHFEDPQVFRASISYETDAIKASITNLGGGLVEEHDFAIDARIYNLEAKIRFKLKPTWNDICFLTDDGSKVDKANTLREYSTLTVSGKRIGDASFQGWSPATDATFDGGVVAVSEEAKRVACIWFEAEN